MAIVAAAVVPHSPLLLPTIAKEHYSRSAQTRAALLELGQELYATRPDVVVVITPHGAAVPGTISIEQGDQLSANLREFGDLETILELRGAVEIAHQLKEVAEDAQVPLILQSRVGLDYGVMVPWLCLWPTPVPWSVLSVTVGDRPTDELLRLGQLLRDFFQSQLQRIAMIASGDAARRRGDAAESERRPTPLERTLSEAIVQSDPSRLPPLPIAGLCLGEPLAILLAAMQGLSGHGVIRSFEVPFTVGQIVATIDLP